MEKDAPKSLDDKYTYNALEYNPGQHGPTPVTGNFDTREGLEHEVARLLEGGLSQKKTAKACGIKEATLCNIVKKIRKHSGARELALKWWVLYGQWADGVPEAIRGMGEGDAEAVDAPEI